MFERERNGIRKRFISFAIVVAVEETSPGREWRVSYYAISRSQTASALEGRA
jgi:hypothetical protein